MPHKKRLSHWQEAIVLGALLLASPLLLVGSLRALGTNCNDPRQWLPAGFDEADRYEWLQQHFGSDEITVVSWPGCTLSDERVDRLAEALEKRQPQLFERVVTGRDMLRELLSGEIGLSPLVARQRLRGTLVGPDGETTCLVLYLATDANVDRPAAVEHVIDTAQRVVGISRDQLRLGGPTIDAATIDVESQRMLLPLAGLSIVVTFLFTWRQFRNVRLTVMVLSGAVYAAALALTILYVAGGHMNLVMTMLPPLVYVLAISTSIHLVNYYRDAVDISGQNSASYKAICFGWKPCVLSSATTAVGLASLATSDIVPVRQFGIYGAIGVSAALVITLLFLPAALTVWPPRLPRENTEGGPSNSHCLVSGTVCQWRCLITMASLVLMVVTGCGLVLLKSTVSLQYRFGPGSRIIADYRWLESHLGPLVPLEVVLDFPTDHSGNVLDRILYVDRLQRELARLEDVGATVSAADFMPYIPTGRSFGDIAARSYLRRRLDDNQQALYKTKLVADGDSGHQLWRITVRAAALENIDFGRFTADLERQLQPLLAEHPEVQATYTGMIPLIYKAQRELLNDLVESFLMAFALIAVVMIVVLGGTVAGLLAMLPNTFPIVVTFGLMGWGDIWIEIGTVMTASAALGIAVDDTFHYLTWFRRGLQSGMNNRDAVRFAFRCCARAMFQTTVVCSTALLVFSLSSFMPIVRFAWLMAILLVVALVGDLVFLPAILASPLGRFFRCRGDQDAEVHETVTHLQYSAPHLGRVA